ncbi:MAG: hypothetical protein IKJ61_03275, partial [Bacteroidaceae bacterium]|nr:hypothetical protein [Bacteroidaceae bacterium]
NEMRCAFVCGSGMVELYNDYDLMNSINDGKLWEDLAECIAWQKKNADVLPDAHWVGGNPWNGSAQEVYGWASWNGAKATLALRNGGNSAQTYTFTLREALEIPANITGTIILTKSFNVQDALQGLTEGVAIDIDQQLTVTLPGSTVFAFDGVNADPAQVPFEVIGTTPNTGVEAIEEITLTFNSEAAGEFDQYAMTSMKLKQGNSVASGVSNYVVNGNVLTVTLATKVNTPGEYTLVIPEGLITRASDGKAFSGEFVFTVITPDPLEVVSVEPASIVREISEITLTFNSEVAGEFEQYAMTAMKFKKGNSVACGISNYVTNGKVLSITLEQTITEEGEYTLVIPEGLITRKSNGDSFSGEFAFEVGEPPVDYTPRNNGTRTNTGRVIRGITLTGASGENSYTLTTEEQGQDYTDATASAIFTVNAGEELTIIFDKAGEWIHQFVFIDFDGDGFTASIAEGSEWAPAEDLVAYSFYNNNSSSDASGWNSVGTVFTGNDRSAPAVPAFRAPEEEGTYRMRIKQDWSNIDPAGDADGKFGDFKANGGQIIDVLLNVVYPTGINDVKGENSKVEGIYDLQGRKIEQITGPGLYIVNGKKVLVK